MKKGFTLVEILASIVILSIITLIAILGYKGITKRIKEQEYENKIKYIENQAAAFASSTGYLSTNVQYLVELGYVKADNDKMEVLNPVNKEVLNDYVVTITREGENYYGHFTNYKESDMDKVDMTNENLEIIEISESGKEIGLNEWTQENVSLRGKIKKNRDSEIVKIRWYSNTEEKEIDVQGNFDEVNNYPIDVVQILNTGYRLEIEFSDGTKYEARRTIKVDKQKPVVYREDVKINNEDTYTKNNKKVKIIASDQRGSGIAGYYLGTDSVCKNNQLYKSSEEYYETELGLGTYYSCVVDNVGNESETISFEVKNIDTTSPTCTIIPDGTMGKNDWYTSDVTFRIEGNDGESGIRNTSLSSSKLTSDSASYTVEGIVTDKAGNEGKCSLTVKRDATKPTCNWGGESTSWTKDNRTITATCQDKMSGCVGGNYRQDYTSGTTIRASLSYGLEDQAGNTNSCSKTVNVYVDKEGPTVPTTGAIGNVSGTNPTGSIQGIAGGSYDAGSGIKEYRYKVTNNGTTPDKNSFTTNRNFTRACGTSYYAWAVAVDNVGNISDVKFLGSTSDGLDTYYAVSSCSALCGTGTQIIKNACSLRPDQVQYCATGIDCCANKTCTTVWEGPWSSCSGSYHYHNISQVCTSNYNGQSCPGKDVEDGWCDENSGGGGSTGSGGNTGGGGSTGGGHTTTKWYYCDFNGQYFPSFNSCYSSCQGTSGESGECRVVYR